ncbi:RICIN domain-containing protein [Kitasatospora sp. NPDC057015]|uniref:RICIN domain-containing protein n=1 Tax=Kitasatospora sp. NPDC057015 TaxID=3346001 RepID=UPI00362F5A76
MRTPSATVRRVAVAGSAALALSGLVSVSPADATTTPAPHVYSKNGTSWVRACDTLAKGDTVACNALRVITPAQPAQQLDSAAAATHPGLTPSDLLSAYNLPTDGGEGMTIAIVDAYDSPTAESDLAVYRDYYGLPACTTVNGCLSKISQTGSTTDLPAYNIQWADEISLDLEMVSAIAPKAKIILVEAKTANLADLGTAVNKAVSLGAKFVSNSYIAPESSSDSTYDAEYFNHPGVAITASSGDSGYRTGYPATSQYVTAVGGTALKKDTSARGWSETVWSTSSTIGAGSGCSTYSAKPSWQKDTGCSKRTVSDVSAVGDPATGVAIYQTYGNAIGWTRYGGTSTSAPIIAAVYALAGTPPEASVPASFPYAHTSSLNDVTSGSTGTCTPTYLCTAAIGYDGPTGLGTPNGTAAFKSTPDTSLNGPHTLVTSGKALDDPNHSTATGTQLITYSPNGGPNQKWVFTQQTDSSYQIVNGESKLCMDVSGSSTTAGAKVIQSTCTGTTSQRWTVAPASSGGYKIASKNGGLLLTTASTANGALATQQADTDSALQRWTIG